MQMDFMGGDSSGSERGRCIFERAYLAKHGDCASLNAEWKQADVSL